MDFNLFVGTDCMLYCDGVVGRQLCLLELGFGTAWVPPSFSFLKDFMVDGTAHVIASELHVPSTEYVASS